MTPEQLSWTDLERTRVEPASPTIRAHAPGYPSYARVFFPVTTNGAHPKSWSQVLGRAVTPDIRWDDRRGRRLELETATGDLPNAVAALLLRLLGGDRDTIAFGYWAGHADISRPADAFAVALPPEERELWFVRRTGDDIADLMTEVGRGPMRWYPDHRRWSVTGDIYDRSVIVGGSHPTINAVINSRRLESVRVSAALPRSVLS